MRHLLAGLMMLGVVAASASAGGADAVKKELANLDGTWRLVSGEEDGKALPDLLVENLKLQFKGDQLTVKGIDDITKKAGKILVVVDPASSPKCIDLKVELGTEKGRVFEGIYELKGDVLKMCLFTGEARNRPSAFATKEGANLIMFVLKKEKS